MVVKSKRGRRRYIAVRVREGSLTDEDLLAVLQGSLGTAHIAYKVIQFNGRMGIVRVGEKDRHRAVDALNAAPDGKLETLRTSGTLRTLRERYFEAEKAEAR
jgi:RNase P/RNase MRP subunit POP5